MQTGDTDLKNTKFKLKNLQKTRANKHYYGIYGVCIIDVSMFMLPYFSGNPTVRRARNIDFEDSWDVSQTAQKYGVISNATAVLTPANHTHTLPPAPTLEQLELETQRQFDMLQVRQAHCQFYHLFRAYFALHL